MQQASLGGLATRLHYSEDYTGEMVRSVMKMSFPKLLQDRRCALAAKLLAQTELFVEEIIHRVGYHNETFFRTVFRQKYGQTPKQYRKSRKEQ